jgi:hypothetical protein
VLAGGWAARFRFAPFGTCTLALFLLFAAGCRKPPPEDEAKLAGLTPNDFPQITADIFQPMDGGIKLAPNDESNRHVYLSDGGHFENLGLYEMVLRRCHYIVVSDAGQDPACSFADLGGAVRKIRIDLGIPIEFGSMSIFARSDEIKDKSGRSCAVGRIRYSVVDQVKDGPEIKDGVLIYIKPACYGDEPRDIYEYFKSNEAFPHESTADQFFSESQFESYRMLGVHTMEQICPTVSADFKSFTTGVKKHLAKPESHGTEKNNALKNSNPCPGA